MSIDLRKLFVPCALITGITAGLAAREAKASTDNYVEFQVDANVLSTIMHRQFTGNSNFCPQTIPCPSSPQSTCVVDHVDIGPPGTWSRQAASSNVAINSFTTVQERKIIFSQTMTAQIKTLTCANTPSCNTTTAFPLSLTYELFVNSAADLCIHSLGINGLPANMTPLDTNLCVGLKTDDVMALTGMTSGTPSGAAVSTNIDGTRIGVRVEYGRTQAQYTPARTAAWQAFADGTLDTSGASGDWSMLMHKSLIVAALEQRVSDGMSSVDGFELTTPMSVSWTPLAASGVATGIDFSVGITNTPCPNVIGADVSLSGDIGINGAHDGVLTEGSIAWDLDDGDVGLCGFLFGGPIGVAVLGAIGSSFNVDLTNLLDGCQATGDTSFECNQKTHPQVMSIGPGQSAVFNLSGVFGSTHGLTMNGGIVLNGAQAVTTNVEVIPLMFGASGGCAGAKKCQYVGGLTVSGTARLCHVDFTGNSFYEITPPPDLSLPADYEITLPIDLTPAEKQQYAQSPNLIATVWTAAGVHAYAIPPATLLDDAQEDLICGIMKAESKWRCVYVHTWPWQKIFWPWWPDVTVDFGRDVGVLVLDARGNQLDYGLVTGLGIEVLRDRAGYVTSVTIYGSGHLGAGGEDVVTQSLALPVSVPRGTNTQDNAQLIRQLLPSGYSSYVALDRNVPAAASGGGFRIDISQDQLQAAVRR